MSVTVTKRPGIYVFAGNPVLFELESDTQDEILLSVTVYGHDPEYFSLYPYKSADKYKARITIGDYLKTFFLPYSIVESQIIMPVSGFSIGYQVKLSDDIVFAGTAFRGGISKSIYTKLADNQLDIFSYRLNDKLQQFLFTTRTHKKEIRIRQSELYPIIFIHPGVSITFESGSGNSIVTDPHISGTICSMDINALLSEFDELYGDKPDEIRVITGELAFTIYIEPAIRSEEKYIVRFLNSMGAYEQIEVTGIASHAPTTGEEDTWLSPNKYDFLEEKRDRVTLKDIIEVETGYRRKDDLLFCLDMITSEEIYFIYPDGAIYRYLATADTLKWRHRIISPTSIPLKFRRVMEEEYYTPEPDLSLISEFGIFDDTFDDTFE